MSGLPIRIARRPRGFVAVTGPDAASYLERMLSNEVETLELGETCEALLLTPKARVIAPMVVWRRAVDDFLLLTERELADTLRRELVRSRFAAKAQIELEEHVSTLVLGEEPRAGAIVNRDYGVPAYELLDEEPRAGTTVTAEELEHLRILARTPRAGREIDERALPAEAGLDVRAISFGKGCYPGQEPVARLHYRGHPNRTLRVLRLEGEEAPADGGELTYEGKPVGRVTSIARDAESGYVALAYVRREVPAEAELQQGSRTARQLDFQPSRP